MGNPKQAPFLLGGEMRRESYFCPTHTPSKIMKTIPFIILAAVGLTSC